MSPRNMPGKGDWILNRFPRYFALPRLFAARSSDKFRLTREGGREAHRAQAWTLLTREQQFFTLSLPR